MFWEWPSTSALWSCPEVVRMKQVIGASSVDLSSAALGLKFLKKEGDKVREMYLKKKWRAMSNCAEYLALMSPFSEVPDLPADRFIECKGKIAKNSANYPPRMS